MARGQVHQLYLDMPELMAKEDEIVQGDKLKVRLSF